jgi:protein disulfide isomerase
LKSDPIPVDNEGPLIQVVGKSFEDIVMDPTKDVFVKFYAPWCGHCKKLAPVWEELAQEMKDYKDLVIAKFDATTNEALGVSIRSYPTIVLYPRDHKEGVKYEGDRSKEMFVAYLKDVAPSVR